jgi:putative nucleotidyltransferase with HDIG domain
MDNKQCSSEGMKEIFEVAQSISSILDVDALLKRIDAAAEKLLNAEAASILLLDESRENLLFKVASGEKGGAIQKLKIAVGEGISGWVAKEKKSVIANDAQKDERFTTTIDQALGFTTRSVICVPMIADSEVIGVVEVVNKKDNAGFSSADLSVLEGLSSLAAASIGNARQSEDYRNFFMNIIELLIAAIESRDPKLVGHSWKVAQLSTTLGRRMGLEDKEYKDLYYGSLLHDIGLLSISDNIAVVDGIITVRERDAESSHPKLGAELIRNINLLKGAVPVIRSHHENFDGTGYPDSLAGEAIPLGARVVAVAEAVEEMRMSGVPEDRIRQMLKLGQETRFDPQIVGAYLKESNEATV